MDIKIKTENNLTFNYCARAIIEQEGKFLFICVNDAPYYHLPGGHVEIGETSKHAVMREVIEEAGFEIEIEKLVVVSEEFYKKGHADVHSIIFYYLARPKTKVSTLNVVRMEQGRTKLIKNELRWVNREEMQTLEVLPELIKKLILENKLDTLQHFV